jgi:hypothetical protein
MPTVEAPKAKTAAQHMPAASLENERESVTVKSLLGWIGLILSHAGGRKGRVGVARG